jgi:hypothetical protein
LIGVGAVLIGALSFATTCFGVYFAMASALKSDMNEMKNDIIGEINGETAMLEIKLDGQDRRLAAQDDKVDGFGEKVDLQHLKFELKKHWSWFGLSASPVKSEDRNVNDAVSKVTKNLDAKVNAAVADKLVAFARELKAETRDQMRAIDVNSS